MENFGPALFPAAKGRRPRRRWPLSGAGQASPQRGAALLALGGEAVGAGDRRPRIDEAFHQPGVVKLAEPFGA